MSVKAIVALAAMQISIPLQKTPPRIERPIAPIEQMGPQFAHECKDWDDYNKPAPPVRIHANTYYVGTCGVSSILITGKAGDILIDGGTQEDADLIIESIRWLGFRPSDVKIILHSHEHFDHVGGIGRLQQLIGAQLFASADAARVFATGAPNGADPQAAIEKPFPTARVDRIIHDGDTVILGDLFLTAVATPGHTPGALTWHWGSCDGGICRRIVYADSLTPVSSDNYRFSDHPEYLAAYRSSIAKVAALNCDILLTPHPSASDMVKRFGTGKPLLDPDSCKTYAAELTKQLDERIAKETASK
jgi:metallo-beta-lactamase class B